ncbi:hypothetical protein MASR2M70_05300 [Bacillota bacterium]
MSRVINVPSGIISEATITVSSITASLPLLSQKTNPAKANTINKTPIKVLVFFNLLTSLMLYYFYVSIFYLYTNKK